MNEPFTSKGTTIYGKRNAVIMAEIKAIRDSYTAKDIEDRLTECARREWFTAEHAEYWHKRFIEKTGKAHF